MGSAHNGSEHSLLSNDQRQYETCPLKFRVPPEDEIAGWSDYLGAVLSSELSMDDDELDNVHSATSLLDEDLNETMPNSKVRDVSSYIGLGLVAHLLISVYYAWVRNQRHLLEQILSTAVALFINILSVGEAFQVSTVSKFYLLPRVIKSFQEFKKEEEQPEKSVQCQVLHDPGPELRRADVIFIHGIKGALEKTWTQGLWDIEWKSDNGEILKHEGYTKCWPRDWLPVDCPYARVIALNYTTDPYLWRPFWVSQRIRSSMSERSWEMMNNLIDIGVGKHSIIWVGHSKGGLYVKQVLVHACEGIEEKYKILSQNTKGVLFYSVPHRGSPLANLNLPLFRRSIELTEVRKNCADVLTLHEKFLNLLITEQLNMNVKSFYETQHTLMSFVYLRIVSEESADAQVGETYGVPLDHRNICKPKSRECFLYQEVVNLVKTACEEMPT